MRLIATNPLFDGSNTLLSLQYSRIFIRALRNIFYTELDIKKIPPDPYIAIKFIKAMFSNKKKAGNWWRLDLIRAVN
ncbi:hypothetical protein MYVALT_G_01550 [Candidatus Vallotia tarda]|uniref:Uncharacterized protein n=1 Tax=Candidatus Vallotiella hemipterorum TaxID=1177213 RepID=A0A916NUG3_9BURK|nr:hypothetical protein MYVALT_G_01550 [Candidatus Vallotia tarda]